jgi:hypothetical protein
MPTTRARSRIHSCPILVLTCHGKWEPGQALYSPPLKTHWLLASKVGVANYVCQRIGNILVPIVREAQRFGDTDNQQWVYRVARDLLEMDISGKRADLACTTRQWYDYLKHQRRVCADVDKLAYLRQVDNNGSYVTYTLPPGNPIPVKTYMVYRSDLVDSVTGKSTRTHEHRFDNRIMLFDHKMRRPMDVISPCWSKHPYEGVEYTLDELLEHIYTSFPHLKELAILDLSCNLVYAGDARANRIVSRDLLKCLAAGCTGPNVSKLP